MATPNVRQSVNTSSDAFSLVISRRRIASAAPLRDARARRRCRAARAPGSRSASASSSRRRVTPSASRTATSRWRRSARARNRFATLAQAMSRTIAATPVTHNAVRASRLGSGPAPTFIAPAIRVRLRDLDGVSVPVELQLRVPASQRTPGSGPPTPARRSRRASGAPSISIQPQLYVV